MLELQTKNVQHTRKYVQNTKSINKYRKYIKHVKLQTFLFKIIISLTPLLPQTALANGVLTIFDLKGLGRPGPGIGWLSGLGGFQKSSIFSRNHACFLRNHA